MLRVENLRKTFAGPEGELPVAVVDVEKFSMVGGDQLAMLGASGSGKTTFMHLLAGILTADSGVIEYVVGASKSEIRNPKSEVRVAITSLDEAGRDRFRGQHIGYIFQTHHLLPGLTALENVLMGMAFTGRRADRAWATHLLERVGLSDRLSYKPAKMSLGQQQRVAVARALANRPQLVLADEPTGALDVASAQQTLDLIRTLCREISAGLLLVTHDLDIARQLPRQVQLAELNRAAKDEESAGAG